MLKIKAEQKEQLSSIRDKTYLDELLEYVWNEFYLPEPGDCTREELREKLQQHMATAERFHVTTEDGITAWVEIAECLGKELNELVAEDELMAMLNDPARSLEPSAKVRALRDLLAAAEPPAAQ